MTSREGPTDEPVFASALVAIVLSIMVRDHLSDAGLTIGIGIGLVFTVLSAVYEPVAIAADGPVPTINSETTGSSSTQQYYFLVDTEEESGARLWAGSGYPRGY